MKRLFETCLAALFLMILVCACSREEAGGQDYPAESSNFSASAKESEGSGKSASNEETGVGDMEIPQTGWTEAVPAEYHAYEGLSHGFGLGTGTVAEGWINDAVAFWEQQM